MQLEIGTQVDERDTVLGRVGRGAMTAVYRVRHLQLGTEHALKVLHVPTYTVQGRLRLEGQIQARCATPTWSRSPTPSMLMAPWALVMDLVRGPSLEAIQGAGSRCLRRSASSAPAVGGGIIRGAAAAHTQG